VHPRDTSASKGIEQNRTGCQMAEPTRLTLSAYRTRDVAEESLVAHMRREIGLLRAHGHITARPVPICRTAPGQYLVVSEWTTPRSVDEAHADAEVVAIWEEKARLVDYLGLAELDRSETPFVSYEVIETL